MIRLPAEWEPIDCVWVSAPQNLETWPGCFDRAAEQHQTWCDIMRRVGVNVRDLAEVGVPVDDAWCRDYLPIFTYEDDRPAHSGLISPDQDVASNDISNAGQRLVAHDFVFNGWGGKYGPQPRDVDAARRLIEALNPDEAQPRIDYKQHRTVLEGGSIDSDGRGTVLTTRQCLLNANRGHERTEAWVERMLQATLGVTRVIWLPGGIAGDDTDGHVDDVARFLAPGLVAAVLADASHPDRKVTQANHDALVQARDALDRRLTIVPLPAPEPMFPFEAHAKHGGGQAASRTAPAPLPASYANFVFVQGHLFVPVFEQRSDEVALRRLDDAVPDATVVPVPAEALVEGLGALHCLSMQQPAHPAA